MNVERREHPRNGRVVAQYRVVCGCGWVCGWRTGRWWAEDQRDRHKTECAVARRPVLIGQYVHASPEWHAARATRLGGSEIAAVVGLSPWESYFSLWHRKAGLVDFDRDNDEMRAGTLLEPVIVGKFAADHPDWRVLPQPGSFHHADRDWQLANPDGIVNTPAGLALFESKFSTFAEGFGEEGTDQVPEYYAVQAQWYLDVFSYRTMFLGLFVGACAQFREYVIHANPARQAYLRDAGAAFIASVRDGRRPPIDGHNATYETVRRLHPDIDGGSIDLPAEVAEPFCRAKHAEAAAKAEVRRATSVLADAMGTTGKAFYDGRAIARRQARGGGVPYVQAERDLPFADHQSTLLEAAS